MIALLLHLAVMLAAAPLVAGVADWSAARLGGRCGPSVLQPWRRLRRLARKPATRPDGTSWVFARAPAAALSLLLACAALVPSFTLGMATAPLADLLVVGGLLAAARAALCCGLIDGGGAEGGAAAARLGVDGAAGAAALALVVLTLALVAGSTNLDAAVAGLREARSGATVALLLALAGGALAGLERAGRLTTVGGPASAAGEWSGRDLALLEAADMLAVLVWLSLAAALFLPLNLAPAAAPWRWGGGSAGAVAAPAGELVWLWAQGLAGWAIKVGVGGLLLGGVRAVAPRLGAAGRAELLGVATALAGLAALLALLGGAGA